MRIPSCMTGTFAEKVRSLKLEDGIKRLIDPLLAVIEQVDVGLAKAEAHLSELCAKEPVVLLLATAPGIGLVVVACIVSVLDEAERFRGAHQVESYAGLVPSENTTGGKRRLGAISKAGNRYLRSLLVQAAWVVLQGKNKNDPLYLWGHAVAKRRGSRIAAVAVARRLLGVLWAMWRDGTVYDPEHLAQQGARGLRRAKQSLKQRQEALERAAKKRSVHRPQPRCKAPPKSQKTTAANAA